MCRTSLCAVSLAASPAVACRQGTWAAAIADVGAAADMVTFESREADGPFAVGA